MGVCEVLGRCNLTFSWLYVEPPQYHDIIMSYQIILIFLII